MTSATSSEDAIYALLAAATNAWERGDANAYAKCFTADCRYIAFFGSIYRGRSEIEGSHRALFAGPLKGTRLFVDVIELRFPGEDFALLMTRGDAARSRPASWAKVQTYLVIREAGAWRFAHFQNTKRLALMRWLTYRAGPDAVPSLDQ